MKHCQILVRLGRIFLEIIEIDCTIYPEGQSKLVVISKKKMTCICEPNHFLKKKKRQLNFWTNLSNFGHGACVTIFSIQTFAHREIWTEIFPQYYYLVFLSYLQ